MALAVLTKRSVASLLAVAFASAPLSAQERYLDARVDGDGVLRIVTARGEIIAPGPQPDREFDRKQVGYDRIQISPGGEAVGWLAMFPNCCTSYPIPLELVVYADGIKRAYTGVGLPIFRWRFLGTGDRVAFRQETVHGGFGVHYELRNVKTGELLAEYQPRVGPDNRILPDQSAPDWVATLDAGP